MYLENFYERYKLDESIVENLGFNPYYIEIKSGLHDKININGKQYINLASNNYLGLAMDERVIHAIKEATTQYGSSLCGTPVATGYTALYKKAEEKLSSFVGLQDTLIFPSCYQANNGLFCAIAGKEDIIIVDRCAHSSLIQGIKSAGCKIRPFLHNDMEHLEGILKNSQKYRQIFVVTESVFSTDGSIVPFKEMVNLCKAYDALPIIDDSHGIGVLGKSGKGILEEEDIVDYQGIYTASLGKALANSGGIICGKKKIMDYLRYYCPHLVYSTAVSPASLAGIDAVLDIINIEYSILSAKVLKYKNIVLKSLIESGFEVVEGRAPINSIKTGTKESTFNLSKRIFEAGILTTPFIEPSVPINEGVVRLIAGANLKENTVNEAAYLIKNFRNS